MRKRSKIIQRSQVCLILHHGQWAETPEMDGGNNLDPLVEIQREERMGFVIEGIIIYVLIGAIAFMLDEKYKVTSPQVYFVLGGIAAAFLVKSF